MPLPERESSRARARRAATPPKSVTASTSHGAQPASDRQAGAEAVARAGQEDGRCAGSGQPRAVERAHERHHRQTQRCPPPARTPQQLPEAAEPSHRAQSRIEVGAGFPAVEEGDPRAGEEHGGQAGGVAPHEPQPGAEREGQSESGCADQVETERGLLRRHRRRRQQQQRHAEGAVRVPGGGHRARGDLGEVDGLVGLEIAVPLEHQQLPEEVEHRDAEQGGARAGQSHGPHASPVSRRAAGRRGC